MIYMKKVRFSSHLGAKVRYQEPLGAVSIQPCDWSRAILVGNYMINIFGEERENLYLVVLFLMHKHH